MKNKRRKIFISWRVNYLMEEVDNWWRQALHDLRASEYNLQGNLLDTSSFLSQQAIEKALKALYLQERKILKKTPSISLLAKELNLPTELIKKISQVEPIYQKTRYPDVSEKIPAEDFEKSNVVEFLNIAKEVIEWVKKKMKQ